jgi:hypothetical protein
MRGDHNASFHVGEIIHQRPQPYASRRIQPRVRFIEQHDIRMRDQCARKQHAPGLPVGKLAIQPIGETRRPDLPQHAERRAPLRGQ